MGEIGGFSDEELLPISALQHLLFCERQCALIHVEGVWRENRLTAEGRVVHERAHGGAGSTSGGVRFTRSLPLASARLGLAGIADVVEFHANGTIVPVEYKRGAAKKGDADRVQLCAQALCLEEMVGRAVTHGAIFYARTKRRVAVEFSEALRAQTCDAVLRLRTMVQNRVVPRAAFEKKCLGCSLLDDCMPSTTAQGRLRSTWTETLTTLLQRSGVES